MRNRKPRTIGELRADWVRISESLLFEAKRKLIPQLRPEVQAYWQEYCRCVADLVSEAASVLGTQDPSTPLMDQRVLLPCSELGCRENVYDLAYLVWLDRNAKREPRRWCSEHAPRSFVTKPASVTPATSSELLAELVRLDRSLFAESWDTPRMMALHDLGLLDRFSRRWVSLLNILAREVGHDAIREARADAETLHFFSPEYEPPYPDDAPSFSAERTA